MYNTWRILQLKVIVYSNHSINISLASFSHQQYGQTPVYTAAEEGHSDIVQMLIQANADINHPNEVRNFVYLCVGIWGKSTREALLVEE